MDSKRDMILTPLRLVNTLLDERAWKNRLRATLLNWRNALPRELMIRRGDIAVQVQTSAFQTRLQETEVRGGAARQIDDPAVNKWPAIVYGHHDAAAVGKIGHLEPRPERQTAVRGGQCVLIVNLAVRGLAAMKLAAVPGRYAAFPVTGRICNRVVALAQHLVGRCFG